MTWDRDGDTLAIGNEKTGKKAIVVFYSFVIYVSKETEAWT